MASRNSRRNFLGLLGGGTGAALLAGSTAQGQEPEKGKKPTYQGSSKKGDLQEAIGLAVAAAQKAAPGADRLVAWTLKTVSGKSGGIAGLNELTATIEVAVG